MRGRSTPNTHYRNAEIVSAAHLGDQHRRREFLYAIRETAVEPVVDEGGFDDWTLGGMHGSEIGTLSNTGKGDSRWSHRRGLLHGRWRRTLVSELTLLALFRLAGGSRFGAPRLRCIAGHGKNVDIQCHYVPAFELILAADEVRGLLAGCVVGDVENDKCI